MESPALTDPLQKTLAVFENTGTPLTTTEVTESLDVGRRSTYDRLERLVEYDYLETKQVGASARVWWRPARTAADTERAVREQDAFVESLLESQRDLIYSFDTDGEFLQWNDQFREVTGYSDAELAEMQLSNLVPDEAVEETTAVIERVLEDGESVTVELPLETNAGETVPYEFTGSPMTDEDGRVVGLAGIGRDISERKVKERQLERQREDVTTELDEVFTRIDDAFYAVDDEFQFIYVNDRAEELLQHSEEELLGRSVWDVFPAATETPAYDAFQTALEEQRPTEYEVYFDTLEFWVEANVYPSESGMSVYFRDITKQKQRERELRESEQRYRTLAEYFPNGIVTLFDHDLEYTLASGQGFEDIPVEPEFLVGKTFWEVWDDDTAETLEPAFQGALDGEHRTVELTYVGREWVVHGVPITDERGDVFAGMTMAQDITERKEREQELRETKAQLEAATEAGSIGTWEWHIPEDQFVTSTWFAELFGVDPERAREGVSLDEFVSAIHEDDRERVEAAIEEAVTSCGEYEEEYRVWDAEDELRWVVARGHVECDEDGNPVTFPGALIDITKRKRAEQELERQRTQLATLNDLNNIVREITDAVLDQSTREEIEQVVCDALAAADAYEFAWLAGVDSTTNTFEPRTTAGTRGYTDEVTISMDPDDPTSEGPGATAIREQETQVVQNVFENPSFEPWREVAAEYGYSSVASIPIVHEGTVYGVLGVYADRENAFDTAEREVISQLGEVVGHAIAAVESKRALMSDEAVELTFQIRNVFEDISTTELDGTITFDEVVPVKDDDFLVYGMATPDARAGLETLVDHFSHWKGVTCHDDSGETTFELQLSEPPVISTFATLGASLEEATLEDGNYSMTVHLPPSADISQFIDTVTETYPDAEMVTRRQMTRTNERGERLDDLPSSELTDRQRAALQAAYYSGFFDWPRETSGDEVADSLDIASPTFHQHLRKAEQKIFDSLFSAEESE